MIKWSLNISAVTLSRQSHLIHEYLIWLVLLARSTTNLIRVWFGDLGHEKHRRLFIFQTGSRKALWLLCFSSTLIIIFKGQRFVLCFFLYFWKRLYFDRLVCQKGLYGCCVLLAYCCCQWKIDRSEEKERKKKKKEEEGESWEGKKEGLSLSLSLSLSDEDGQTDKRRKFLYESWEKTSIQSVLMMFSGRKN